MEQGDFRRLQADIVYIASAQCVLRNLIGPGRPDPPLAELVGRIYA